ncbi:MAG: DUF1361 domain-containing protein [Bacteroidia bacterium]|jgi:uncharacterized membrane protein|nr:DUF1361 domain-containing protein [Bacteroidia bacterium]
MITVNQKGSSSRVVRLLLLSTGFSVMLILLRVGFTGRLTYLFLVWNLFLAWVPFLVAGWMRQRPFMGRMMFLCTGFIWLLFLPNAPYILTDLFHLKPNQGAPFWFDWLVLLSAGWTGLLLGLVSLRRMEQEVSGRIARRKSRNLDFVRGIFVPVVLLLSAFGVYLGRFERTNSWEVMTNPFGVVSDVLSAVTTPRALGISLLFGFLLILIWYGFETFREPVQTATHHEHHTKAD